MSRAQFLTLNLVGGICALLILFQVFLAYSNGVLAGAVGAIQSQYNQAQQVQSTAQNLVVRVAQAGARESALRELLVRHDFKVTLSPESQAKAP